MSSRDLEKIDFSKLLKDAGKEEKTDDKLDILRAKVRTVARMQRLFKNLR